MIRLKQIRPRFVPGFLGVSSENAAHRIAVEWDRHGETHEGVYVPRRDTSSWLNTMMGGRLFPGLYNHARFQVRERNGHYSVAMQSGDREMFLSLDCECASKLSKASVFTSIDNASDFFEAGALGYSAAERDGEFDGMELRSVNWKVAPLSVKRMQSSFFEDEELFPRGSIEFDSALLMQNIEHEWHAHPTMCSASCLRTSCP